MAASWVLLKAFRNFQMSSIGRRKRTSVSTYNSESTSFRITWYQRKYLVTVGVVRWKAQTNEERTLSSEGNPREETASGQHMAWRVSSIRLHSPQRRWLDICYSETWRTPSEATDWTVRGNWKNQSMSWLSGFSKPHIYCLQVTAKRSLWGNLYQFFFFFKKSNIL